MLPQVSPVSAMKASGKSCVKPCDLVGPSGCSFALHRAMIWSPSVMPVPETPMFSVDRLTPSVLS